MLNKNLEIELNKQQILPILNTTELRYDIKRLEVFLLNNPNIKNIEITLRQENSFEIAKEINKNFAVSPQRYGRSVVENILHDAVRD